MRASRAPAGAPPEVFFVIGEVYEALSGGGRSLGTILRHLRGVRPVVLPTDSPALLLHLDEGALTVERGVVDAAPILAVAEGLRRRSVAARLRVLAALARSNLRVWRRLRRSRPAALHCNSLLDLMAAGAGARLAGVPLVLNIRATPPADVLRAPWQVALVASARVIVLSEEMRRFFVERAWRPFRARAERTVVAVYSGLPLHEIEPYLRVDAAEARRRLGLPAGGVLAGYVGEVRPVKGQADFIRRALPPALAAAPDLAVVFVGAPRPGPEGAAYLEECRRAADEAGVGDRVRFVGHQDEVALWMRACDFTVLASRLEGLARVFLESLACGRPVAAMDVASAREVLEETGCGIVAPQGDHAALAEAVARLANDAALREEMGRRGSALARERFDILHTAGRYEAVYLELAGRRGERGGR